MLGGSPADLLFPNNFIIVEGRSDHEFLSIVIQRFYSDQKPLQIVFASGEAVQQHRSVDAIHKVYNPLWLRPIYKERAVVLCDKPRTPEQVKQLEEFKMAYPVLLQKPEKLFQLTLESLEQYYPVPWRKTVAEVAGLKGADKVQLARTCAAQITQKQFESEMPILHESLKRAWELAY